MLVGNPFPTPPSSPTAPKKQEECEEVKIFDILGTSYSRGHATYLEKDTSFIEGIRNALSETFLFGHHESLPSTENNRSLEVYGDRREPTTIYVHDNSYCVPLSLSATGRLECSCDEMKLCDHKIAVLKECSIVDLQHVVDRTLSSLPCHDKNWNALNLKSKFLTGHAATFDFDSNHAVVTDELENICVDFKCGEFVCTSCFAIPTCCHVKDAVFAASKRGILKKQVDKAAPALIKERLDIYEDKSAVVVYPRNPHRQRFLRPELPVTVSYKKGFLLCYGRNCKGDLCEHVVAVMQHFLLIERNTDVVENTARHFDHEHIPPSNRNRCDHLSLGKFKEKFFDD